MSLIDSNASAVDSLKCLDLSAGADIEIKP